MLGVEQAKDKENVKNGRKISELEGEIRHFKKEAQVSGEEKDAVVEELQRVQAEVVGCGGEERVEEKMRERLEGLEVQNAELLGEIKRLQQALIEQTERAEAQQREMEHAAATATSVAAAATAAVATNATSAAVAATGEDGKADLAPYFSTSSSSSSSPTPHTTVARETILEEE
eukprot:evm.model.NODE_7874_length_9055_cov_21.155384.4